MNRTLSLRGLLSASAACLATMSTVAHAQEPDARTANGRATGSEIWASTDSDGTDVLKVLGRGLWHFDNTERYAGVALEHVWFSPAAGEDQQHDRVYIDAADTVAGEWRWRARVGTDGQTVLGSAEFRRADWSRSFFVEREIIETGQGLRNGIYYTFAGASTDVQLGGATLAVTAGLQEFSGRNERLHLRGRYVQPLRFATGLSVQLDTRYYHSTAPGEFDYFSPRDFVRVIPLAQIRRFTRSGWMFLGAAGVGGQQATGVGWSVARHGQLRIESPRGSRNMDAFAELIYTNDSLSGGVGYHYAMGRTGLTWRF